VHQKTRRQKEQKEPNAMNDLVQVPKYLLDKYGQSQPNRKQFGQLEAQDFGLNFLKIVHGSSKQAAHGWGPTSQEPALAVGTMFLSRDGTIIPSNTPFIPLYRNVRYIYWEGTPGNGRIIFMTSDKHDSRIKEIRGLEFIKNKATGEIQSPLVTTYINFYIMVKGSELPCILSFKRTGIPDGRRFTQDLIFATDSGKLPMFACTFLLGPVRTVKDGNLIWYHPTIKAAGFTAEAMIDRAAKMSELAESLSNMATEAEFEASESDSLEQAQPIETELKTAHPATSSHVNGGTQAAPAAASAAYTKAIEAPPTAMPTATTAAQQSAESAVAAPPPPTGIVNVW